ncbi:hypothetical protein TNCV_4485451 [Trichonephila clavipes]|nr:hypothetical protein TNCV_4485451 [Trichonephila clavipes]
MQTLLQGTYGYFKSNVREKGGKENAKEGTYGETSRRKFCYNFGKMASETHGMLVQVYGTHTLLAENALTTSSKVFGEEWKPSMMYRVRDNPQQV